MYLLQRVRVYSHMIFFVLALRAGQRYVDASSEDCLPRYICHVERSSPWVGANRLGSWACVAWKGEDGKTEGDQVCSERLTSCGDKMR